MIITLKGANFSASNIGTLTTWNITKSLGAGATSSNNATTVTRGGSYSTTITLAADYEIGSAGVSVTMGGLDITSTASSISGNTISISISSVTGNVSIKVPTKNLTTGGESGGTDTPVNPPSDGTMTLKAYFDSANAPTTVYKISNGEISWVGGVNYRHCIIPLSSGISHVKIATGTKASGVAGLLYLSSNEITSDSIVEAVYGTNTTFIKHSTFRGLDTNISAPTGATHIAIGEFIDKATIGCTDDDLILTFGESGFTDTPTDDLNNTSTFMSTVGTIADTYKYDGTNLTMVGSDSSQKRYRHVIVPVTDYNITHLCCITGDSTNSIGPVLFLSGSELKAENVIDSKFGTISDASIVLNGSFRLFDEDITIPSGCTHMAWIDYLPITALLDTSKCNYTVTYN